jgi:hypothetical protein
MDTLPTGLSLEDATPLAATEPASSLQSMLIVVLGMHRSGTSVATRAMETLGAEFGNNLGEPVAGVNDKGFFEDLDVHGLNAEMMAATGMKWHGLTPLVFDAARASQWADWRRRARVMLIEKCRGKIFAVKDPRLTRLLPFWLPVFDELGVRVVYVIAARHPFSVAESLHKRDRFSHARSYLLWLAHVVPALEQTRHKPRVLVDYDSLMEAPRAELERIAGQLELPLDPGRAQVFEQDFLDTTLRHSQFKGGSSVVTHQIPAPIQHLFYALQAAVAAGRERESGVLEPALQGARRYLDACRAGGGWRVRAARLRRLAANFVCGWRMPRKF